MKQHILLHGVILRHATWLEFYLDLVHLMLFIQLQITS